MTHDTGAIKAGIWEIAQRTMRANVVGLPRAVSQFGMPYQYWANGACKSEGAAVPVWPMSDVHSAAALDSVASFFGAAAAAGENVAVWREFPDVYVHPAQERSTSFPWTRAAPERWLVIFRLHFMPWAAFIKYVEEAGNVSVPGEGDPVPGA